MLTLERVKGIEPSS